MSTSVWSLPDDISSTLFKSNNQDYISRKIREKIKGSSVTVVLIGDNTAQSEWVKREIQWSLDKRPPNGVLGIRLSPDSPVPHLLTECGAEILNWYEPDDVHEFQAAIERAAGYGEVGADDSDELSEHLRALIKIV